MGLRELKAKINTWLWAVALPVEPEDPADEVLVSKGVELPEIFQFKAWPKTARLLRDIVVTEKIDGTNGGVLVHRCATAEEFEILELDPVTLNSVTRFGPDGNMEYWIVGGQSHNRTLRRDTSDNQGFGAWITANAHTLIDDLGPGRHFGEFWGGKVGRKYGLPADDKRFSLFNPSTKFRSDPMPELGGDFAPLTPGLDVVPVLYEGPFEMEPIANALADLRETGSRAAPGFMSPEGVIVYHTHARRILGKVTLDNQDQGKWVDKRHGTV